MMSRLMATLVVVVMITGLVVAPALAQEEEVAPGGGNAFGKHVFSMAPEHPKLSGPEFGECVSTMARTGSCPHDS